MLKSANFLAHQLGSTKNSRSHSDAFSQRSSTARLPLRVEADPLNTSVQRTASRASSLAAQEYRHLSERVSSEINPKTPFEDGHQDSKDGSDETILLSNGQYSQRDSSHLLHSPRRSLPQPARRYPFLFGVASPRRRTSAASPRPSQGGIYGVDVIREEEGDESAFANAPSATQSPVDQLTSGIEDLSTKCSPPSMNASISNDNRLSLPSDLGSADHESTPRTRRATHRQARMIDGALFHGRLRKGNLVESSNSSVAAPAQNAHESNAHRSSGQSKKHSPRDSWLQNVLTRFRGEYFRKPKQPKLRKRHSSLTSCGINGNPEPDTAQPGIAECAEMRRARLSPGFGLDGARDEYRNKPLPLSPHERHRPSLESDIQRSFFSSEPAQLLFSSADSTLSVSHHAATHNETDLTSLVSATMSGPHELSPKEKAWRYRLSSSASGSGPSS